MTVSRGASSSRASSMQRRESTWIDASGNPPPARRSEPHRHDDVADRGVPGRADQAAAVRTREAELDALGFDRGERIEQVRDVEADLEGIALVVDLDLVLGLFLLGVVRLDEQLATAEREA